MSERLVFPEDDEVQLERDCRDLERIFLSDLEAHCCWLRAMRETPLSVSIPESMEEWTESENKAILLLGPYLAYKKGLVSASLLRKLAHDPDLLTSLGRRIDEGAADGEWPGPDVDEVGRFSPEALAKEFTDLLRAELASSESCAQPIPPPQIESSGLRRTFEGVWTQTPGRYSYEIEVRLAGSTTLSLRWRDRTWGKVLVAPSSSLLPRVIARTGVFLVYQILAPSPMRVTVNRSTENHGFALGWMWLSGSQDRITVTMEIPRGAD